MTDKNRATVLYVEDEEADVFFLRRAFVKAGISGALQVVGDGRSAMAYLAGTGVYADRAAHPFPDLVLLDLNLPFVSGFELLKWIRANPAFDPLPVVIFSSSTRQEDKTKARHLGAFDYFEKPMAGTGFEDLVPVIRERWLHKAS